MESNSNWSTYVGRVAQVLFVTGLLAFSGILWQSKEEFSRQIATINIKLTTAEGREQRLVTIINFLENTIQDHKAESAHRDATSQFFAHERRLQVLEQHVKGRKQ